MTNLWNHVLVFDHLASVVAVNVVYCDDKIGSENPKISHSFHVEFELLIEQISFFVSRIFVVRSGHLEKW